MGIIVLIIQILAAVLGYLTLALSVPLFLRFRWPAAFMWGLKLFVSALSPVFTLVGIFTAILGFITGSVFIGLIGILVVLIYATHIIAVTRPPSFLGYFDDAFGLDWEKHIRQEQKAHFLPKRTVLSLPAIPKPRLEQNISFALIPGTNRELLCDIWQPPENVSPSGVAFIYLHGSAFYILDKDCCTRTFFSYLAAQGHVIMDVAYRLAPETDIMGMVHDAKRAIAWMKEHAGTYGVNTNRVVIGGGSAGGHLALLAAYSNNDSVFIPDGLSGKDTDVCAVISLYGTTDLKALYYHTNQHLTTRSVPGTRKKAVPTKMPAWIIRAMGENYHRLGFDKNFENIGALARLLGGHPDECPERYAMLSPVNHVHPNCPPTLLVHGEHDIMAPVTATRRLYGRLLRLNVAVVMHVLPQTDHGFDLVLPKISSSAHNALYDVERFMALIALPERSSASSQQSIVYHQRPQPTGPDVIKRENDGAIFGQQSTVYGT